MEDLDCYGESLPPSRIRVFSIDLAFEDLDVGRSFEYSPGQFNMLYVPGVGEAAISIAGTSPSGMLHHTIRAVGAVTKQSRKGVLVCRSVYAVHLVAVGLSKR